MWHSRESDKVKFSFSEEPSSALTATGSAIELEAEAKLPEAGRAAGRAAGGQARSRSSPLCPEVKGKVQSAFPGVLPGEGTSLTHSFALYFSTC